MVDGGGLLISYRGVGDCGIHKETERQRKNRYLRRRSSRLVRLHLYVNESTSYDKQLLRTKSCERVFPPKLERGYHVKKQENRLSKIHLHSARCRVGEDLCSRCFIVLASF